jgi:hypothetical protein
MSLLLKKLLGIFILLSVIDQINSTLPSRILQDTSSSDYPTHCRAGCLICSSKDMCLLCDLSLFYLPHGYDCKLNKVENCKKTYDGITCILCDEGYYPGKLIKNLF